MSFRLSDYAYDLPDELIAAEPAYPRDSSRMMTLNKNNGDIKNANVQDLVNFLDENTLMVVNNTRVIPARLPGKRTSGGAIEVLLLKNTGDNIWEAKVRNVRRIKEGETLLLCDGNIQGEYLGKTDDDLCLVSFKEEKDLIAKLEKYAYAPLPPYIQKVRNTILSREEDLEHYQTTFAKNYGAVAAPTASLHFTEGLTAALKEKGIQTVEVTLHVGLGTFEPLKVDDIREHEMHYEQYHVSQEAADTINQAKASGRKILGVGTTTVRTLETAFKNGKVEPGSGTSNLFIYPPYEFQTIDTMLTNFHLPESTLMMLVSAFAGKENIMQAYKQAIEWKYRFFSYGDCMLIS